MSIIQESEAKIKELWPQYLQAINREDIIREYALLPITLMIGGVEVLQMTPLHYMYLDFINSPFVGKKTEIDSEDVAQFLWIVSTEYKERNPELKKQFLDRIKRTEDVEKLIKDIDNYVEETFLDAPFNPEVDTRKRFPDSFYAWTIGYIDTLATAYGWSDEYIIRLPFSRIFQYVKVIDAKSTALTGEKARMINRFSDPFKSQIQELEVTIKTAPKEN